jgi:hypothetical protein
MDFGHHVGSFDIYMQVQPKKIENGKKFLSSKLKTYSNKNGEKITLLYYGWQLTFH